ncbi:MAG: hypothetical protein QXP38_00690 [Nitrososphaerota archaeon]
MKKEEKLRLKRKRNNAYKIIENLIQLQKNMPYISYTKIRFNLITTMKKRRSLRELFIDEDGKFRDHALTKALTDLGYAKVKRRLYEKIK